MRKTTGMSKCANQQSLCASLFYVLFYVVSICQWIYLCSRTQSLAAHCEYWTFDTHPVVIHGNSHCAQWGWPSPPSSNSPYITYHTKYYWYILINLHCIWLHCVTYCDCMMPFNKVVHLENDCWFAHFDMPVVLCILTHLPICANWHVRYVVFTIPYPTVTLTWGPCIAQIMMYVILHKMACVWIPPLSTCSISLDTRLSMELEW